MNSVKRRTSNDHTYQNGSSSNCIVHCWYDTNAVLVDMPYDYDTLDKVFDNIPVEQIICFNIQSVLNELHPDWKTKHNDIQWYSTHTYYYYQADQAIKNGWHV